MYSKEITIHITIDNFTFSIFNTFIAKREIIIKT